MKIYTVYIFIYLALGARTQAQSCPKCVNDWVNSLDSEGKNIQQLLVRTVDVIKSIPISVKPDDHLEEIKQYKNKIEKIFKNLPTNLLTSLDELNVVKIKLSEIFDFSNQSTEFRPVNGSARLAFEIENDIAILQLLLANNSSVNVSNVLNPVDFTLLEYKDHIYNLTKITRVIIPTYWELMNGMKKNKEKQAILDRTERRIAEISSELEKLIQNITKKSEEKLQLQEKIKKKLEQLESQNGKLAKTHEEALKLKERLKKKNQNVHKINVDINTLLEECDRYIDIINNFCLNSTSTGKTP